MFNPFLNFTLRKVSSFITNSNDGSTATTIYKTLYLRKESRWIKFLSFGFESNFWVEICSRNRFYFRELLTATSSKSLFGKVMKELNLAVWIWEIIEILHKSERFKKNGKLLFVVDWFHRCQSSTGGMKLLNFPNVL